MSLWSELRWHPKKREISQPHVYILDWQEQAIKSANWKTSVACRRYPFIIFLNSSVRGPFLPAYMQNSVPWTHVFTSKITEEVRLVGSTINCGRAYESLPVAHVQSYAMATDQAGLQILMHKVKAQT